MLRALAAASFLFAASGIFAQPAATPRPQFEVASIKLNKSGGGFSLARPSPGGRFTLTNIPLQFVLMIAYRVKEFQLSGAPAWLNQERYDIEAKADGNPSLDAMLPMLQTLLEDRLQLKFHHETKELPIYVLAVAKAGKLHESEKGECPPMPNGLPPPPEPGKLPSPPCGGIFRTPGHVAGQKTTMAQLTDLLSNSTGRVVLDKTGLTGKYDINLDYTPEQSQLQLLPGGDPDMPFPRPDPNGPSLFTALQEQLGLKLESQKGPVEIMVIDHVERPSEN